MDQRDDHDRERQEESAEEHIRVPEDRDLPEPGEPLADPRAERPRTPQAGM